MKIGILGFGEIGKAIHELYLKKPPNAMFAMGKVHSLSIKDLDIDDGIQDCDYLHVCIPYSDNFVDQICECIEKETPKNVIIHSTVQVGTTRKIMEKSGLINICHAPVRGVHPNLREGLRTFPMYIGFDENRHDTEATKSSKTVVSRFVKKAIAKVKRDNEFGWNEFLPPLFIDGIYFLLHSIGIHIKVVGNFETSELAKLASTSYYGMCIAFHAEINSLCNEMGLSFEEVMTEWNKQYNDGYKKLDMNHVVRPVLTPPDGAIGGHCIIPNAKLLKDFYYRTMQTREMPNFILKYEPISKVSN